MRKQILKIDKKHVRNLENKIKRPLSLLNRFLMSFGLINGIILLRKIYFAKHKEINILVPGYKYPIVLRRASSDIKVFEQGIVAKDYDISLPRFQPKLIIDGGANIGLTSIFFARKFPEALIIAVEPEEKNYQLLLKKHQRVS